MTQVVYGARMIGSNDRDTFLNWVFDCVKTTLLEENIDEFTVQLSKPDGTYRVTLVPNADRGIT